MSSVGTDPGLLVGRGTERSVLLDSLDRMRSGAGDAIALVGSAGVGKSRLSRELLTAGRAAGVPVLVGRAVSTASAVPYRAVRESLLSWSRSHPLPAGERLGGYGRALDHLLDDGAPDGQPLSPVFIAEAYLRLLAAIGSDAGCVVLLEDLHWADDETLAVVEYLADHAASTGVLAALTSRHDEPSAARPLLDALGARGSLRALRLTPLDKHDVGEMAAGLLGEPVSPSLVDLLHGRSEGVPLLVEELLSALQGTGGLVAGPEGLDAADAAAQVLPNSVADTVRGRLSSLPDEQRRVLETAAVLGRSFAWGRLAPVAGVDEAVALQALRVATDLNLLEPDPVRVGELRFRHALIRDAVAAATFPPQRNLLARKALDALLEGAAEEEARDEDLSLAIELAAQCDDRPVAARLALRLAWRAFMGWSLATAERRLAQARRYAETDQELLVEIDLLQLRVGTMVGRIDVVRTVGGALLARVHADDRDALLETRLRLGQVEAEDGSWQESRRHLDAARPFLTDGADPCTFTRHELWSAVAGIAAGSTDEARAHGLRAIELAEPYDDQVDLVCASLLHLGRLALPDVAEARATWQRGATIATDHGLRLWRGRLLAELGGSAVADVAGDAELEEALTLAREAGAVELTQRVELLRAELALLRGLPDDAARHLDAADIAAGRSAVVTSTRDRAPALRGLLAALRGEQPEAHSPATVRAVAALAHDELDAAHALVGQALAEAPVVPLVPYTTLLTLLDAEPPSTPAGRLGEGLALAQQARSAAEDGDPARATALLAEAAATLRPAPLLAAFTTRLVAPSVTRAGGDEPVRELLRDAAATFDRMGLGRPADACRALLRDTGVAVPRRQSAQAGVPDRLRALGVTARELDVLRLVAEGLTSRDIADRLYLSHRTVEKHVERLLAKTGAANRTALAAVAAHAEPDVETAT